MQKKLRKLYKNILRHCKKYFKKQKESDERTQEIQRIKRNVYEEISAYKKYNKLNEFTEEIGGFLVDSPNLSYAFLLNNVAINKRNNYVYSRKEFIRINKYLNAFFGYKRCRYIGEWHMHISGTPYPSHQDDRAMKLKALVYGNIYLCIAKEIDNKIYYGIYRYTRFGRVTDRIEGPVK